MKISPCLNMHNVIGLTLAMALGSQSVTFGAEREQVVQIGDRIETVAFPSNALSANKRFCVVLPADYSKAKSDWPVLYLLHGRGRNERSLIDEPSTRKVLLDAPFVTVLPSGEDGWYIDSPVASQDKFAELLEETIAVAEDKFHLSKSPEKRAISGWSMGGFGCVRFAVTHPQQFSVVAPMIGLLDFPRSGLPEGQNYEVPVERFGKSEAAWEKINPLNFAEKLHGAKVVLITADQSFDRTMNENFRDRLRELEIEHEWAVLEGTHHFDVVKKALPLVIAKVKDEFSEETSAQPTSMKAWRKDAADRQRRIIFNNDGAEPVVKMTQPSAQEFLDVRTTGLIGSQVDSVFYCPRCSGFGLFTYFTKVGEVFTSKEGRYANNQMEALLEKGIDPLRVIVDFCKQNNKEVFCSFRMNDNHDGNKGDYAPLIFKANKFKNAHPELLLGSPEKKPKIGAWTVVNYAKPEIRELAFRFVEEVCQNYDIDGIELDFFRHAVYFPSTSRGEKATDEERNAMTELLARIRKMADEVGKKRGRPILIAIRLPDSVDYCHAMGLDLERWLAEDLLDLYIPAGTFQLNDWDYSVALARKHGVKVYPSLDDSRVRDPIGKALRLTDLAYRGRAANVWASGADGVYLYNFFDHLKSDSHLLREMGSPEILAKLDKDYLPAARGIINTSGGNLPYEPYLGIETLNPRNPKKILSGKSATARLWIGDSQPQLAEAATKLRLRFQAVPKSGSIVVHLNGTKLNSGKIDGEWVEFDQLASAIRAGENEVTVKRSSDANAPIVWTDMLIQVRLGD